MSHEHVSDLRFDRMLAGELDEVAAAAVRADVDACARCSARLAELERDRGEELPAVAFAQAQARDEVGAARGRRLATRWLVVGPALLAAAAAVFLVVRPRGDAGDHGERVKGTGPALELHGGAPGALKLLSPGDRVHPGDSLQAAYTAKRDGFGAVLSRDGAGAASVYVPMAALPAGTRASYPQSTVLDDVLGDEHVMILWCERSHAVEPLRAELAATGTVVAPVDCTSREVDVEKVGP